MSSLRTPSIVLLSATLCACGGGGTGAGPDTKAAPGSAGAAGDAQAGAGAEPGAGVPGAEGLAVAEGDAAETGPVPPATAMVLYGVEGALLPIACFVKDRGQLAAGDACLQLAPAGDEVRLGTGTTSLLSRLGEAAEPLCLAGSGKKVARAADGATGGATYAFAVWPRGAFGAVNLVSDESRERGRLRLDAATTEALTKAVAAAGGKAGEIKPHQLADLDLDGNGKADRFISVYVPDPATGERNLWSGAFLAIDGDLAKIFPVERARTGEDLFEVRGTVDLDGDGTRELWMRVTFGEGAGDRVVAVAGGKARAVGGWTCGA